MDRQTALRVLNVIADTLDPYAIIAGGYVRDLELGRKPKDLDVYAYTLSDDIYALAAKVSAALKSAGFSVGVARVFDNTEVIAEEMGGYEDFVARLKGLVKLRVSRGDREILGDDDIADVDLLIPREPIQPGGWNVLTSFDVGLSQAALLRDGSEVRTGTFMDDVRNGTLTIIHDCPHAQRMADKFYDRRVVYV